MLRIEKKNTHTFITTLVFLLCHDIVAFKRHCLKLPRFWNRAQVKNLGLFFYKHKQGVDVNSSLLGNGFYTSPKMHSTHALISV